MLVLFDAVSDIRGLAEAAVQRTPAEVWCSETDSKASVSLVAAWRQSCHWSGLLDRQSCHWSGLLDRQSCHWSAVQTVVPLVWSAGQTVVPLVWSAGQTVVPLVWSAGQTAVPLVWSDGQTLVCWAGSRGDYAGWSGDFQRLSGVQIRLWTFVVWMGHSNWLPLFDVPLIWLHMAGVTDPAFFCVSCYEPPVAEIPLVDART